MSSCEVRVGISALVKIAVNSIPIRPRPKKTSAGISAAPSGASTHKPAAPATYSAENSQIHGIRRPVESATAPRTGASSAMMTPVTDSPQPQSACACAPAWTVSAPSMAKRCLATSAK